MQDDTKGTFIDFIRVAVQDAPALVGIITDLINAFQAQGRKLKGRTAFKPGCCPDDVCQQCIDDLKDQQSDILCALCKNLCLQHCIDQCSANPKQPAA